MLYNDLKENKWLEYLDLKSDDQFCRYVLANTPDDILEVLVDLDTESRYCGEPFCNFSRITDERYHPIRDRLMKKRGLTKEQLGYDDRTSGWRQ